MMPPSTVRFNLTILEEYQGPPVVIKVRKGSPVTRVAEILMNGSLKITFDEAIQYRDGTEESLVKYKRRSVLMKAPNERMRDYIDLVVIPGSESDP